LYPIFTTDENNPAKLRNFVDQKLNSVLDEIKQAENELAIRIEKISQMEPKDDTTSDKIVQVKNNLNSIKTKIHSISSDYKDLVDLVKSFLDSVNSCRENISEYFDNKPATVDSSSVENVVKDYESFKNNTMEHFRRLLAQSENIIEKIKQQEPPGAKEHDTDKIITTLEQLRGFFETQTESESSKLKQQHHVIEFDRDFKELINNVGDFGRKVDDKKSQLTESSAATKSAQSSLDYFEQNLSVSI
jgi:chromosome segregation ATPase